MDDILIEIFEFPVTAANQTYNFKVELNKNSRLVMGIQLSADYENCLYLRGSQRFELSGKEYFPVGYESKNFITSINVAPNERMYKFGKNGVRSGDCIVKIQYTDKDHPDAPFTPYTMIMTVTEKIEL